MMAMCVERLKEVNDKMLEWLNQNIKNDEKLYCALYHSGIAMSELDPNIKSRVSRFYFALSAKEQLDMKIQAEYAEFKSEWRGLSADELTKQAGKIAVVNRLMKELFENVNEEQAKILLFLRDPLEVISEEILDGDYAHESEILSLAIKKICNGNDDEEYDESEENLDERETPVMKI